MPAPKFEGVHHQAHPGVGHSPLGDQVDKEGQCCAETRQGDEPEFPARPGQGFPHRPRGLELDRQVGEHDSDRSENPVVLLEADRQGDESAYQGEVPGAGSTLPGQQAFEGCQGQQNRDG